VSDATGYETRSGLAAQFSRQAVDCASAGSPLYADLCRSASLDLAAGGRLTKILAPWDEARDGDFLALRVLAAAHRLVLERQAPALALWFPSVGGSAPVDAAGRVAAFDAFADALAEASDRLPDLLASPPQTNDPARSAALVGVEHHLAAAYGLPLHVHELGASAGLNLLGDRARITWLGGETGPHGSPLVLEDAWTGDPLPPTDVVVDVAERVGVDLAPVDVTTTEGRLHLTSFVWADQLERFERLRAAYELAASTPVALVASDIVVHLASLHVRPGAVLVLFHSATWFYLDAGQRTEAERHLQRLGAEATSGSPVVHVAREAQSLQQLGAADFSVVVRAWPAPSSGLLSEAGAGTPLLLARTTPHGLPVVWQRPEVVSGG
jgi:hypothetical protein